MRVGAAVLAAGLLATGAAGVSPPVVGWRDAPAHVGDIVTVEGDVVSATTTGDTVTLEFAREPGAFHVVLLIPMMSDLPPHPERLYDGKRVRASGRVERFRGRSEMVLRSPGQIQVVDVAAAASGPPATVPPTIASPPAPVPAPAVAPPPAAAAPPPPPAPPPVAPPPAPAVRAAPSTTLPPPPAAPPPVAVVPAPASAPPAAAAPPPPAPAPVAPPPPPRDLAEAVQRRIPALDGCERARTRWRDAGTAARSAADALTRCLDGSTFDCRPEAAAVAPLLSKLEGAAQQVERACPR